MSAVRRIEVFDGATPACAWERSYHDTLFEAAVSFGAEFWDWHLHRWGVVVEFAFSDETARDSFRESAAVRAGLDAVPNPLTGVLVYPHRGGGSGARVPRCPRPIAGADPVALPRPDDQDDAATDVRPLRRLSRWRPSPSRCRAADDTSRYGLVRDTGSVPKVGDQRVA